MKVLHCVERDIAYHTSADRPWRGLMQRERQDGTLELIF